MVHYANNIKAQKKYLNECGYSYKFLNRLSKKEVYYLYRKKEREYGEHTNRNIFV